MQKEEDKREAGAEERNRRRERVLCVQGLSEIYGGGKSERERREDRRGLSLSLSSAKEKKSLDIAELGDAPSQRRVYY